MDNHHTSLSAITPEKLTLLKIKHGELSRDVFSEPTSPTRGHRSISFSNEMMHSSLARRSTSRSASASRRTSSFLHSHRSEMSKELTSQAEGKFFALMDLMSTASREASSLKESWARIVSERETLLRERDELRIRVEEVSESLERRESEYHQHGHESTEKKKHIEKLLVELSMAVTAVQEHKVKIADKDRELERTRTELRELRSSMTHTHSEHDATKAELEATYLRLRACEEDRDHAKDDSHKHHGELRNLLREHTELKSKFTETSTKFETSRKEVLTLNDRIKIWELERDENLHEKDRLQEELRRAKYRAEESSRELYELTERHERAQRDSTKIKETLRVIEIERDEYSLVIENLRRDVKAKTAGWEEADERSADVTLKYEHLKREVISVKEKLREVETREIETREARDLSREQHRLISIERDQLKEDLHDERTKVSDGHRRIGVLEDSLRRVESTFTELRSEIHTLTERNQTLIREEEQGRSKHDHLNSELSGFKEKMQLLQAEIRIVSDNRDRHRKELDEWKHKYEEVTETITEYRDGSGELEFEIESLRTLLREAREQKERAISARHTADRERDEYVSKYEEKCREMEKFEESASAHYHSYGNGGGGGEGKSSFSRTMSSGTAVHHDNHGHRDVVKVHGNGMFSP